jgi:putative endopeptidase
MKAMIHARAPSTADPAHLSGDLPEPIRFDARDLDPAADPREDLDAFVNARWRASHPVPADRSCWDGFAILAERALRAQADIAADAAESGAPPGSVERIVGDFWHSGMHAAAGAGMDLLRDELSRIDELETSAEIAAYVRDRHARGMGVLFRFDAEPDFAAPDRTIACITQGGLGLPDRDDYFDASARGAAKRRAYLAHITTMLELVQTPHAPTLAEDVLAFETRLADASLSRRSIARDIGARFRAGQIDVADRVSTSFPWRLFFHAVGSHAPRRFSLAMPAFFGRIDDALRTTPAHVWRAYLRFHTVNDAAPFLGDECAAMHHRFHGETLRGQRMLAPRWKRTLDAINAHAGEAMGQLYVARCFDPESKREIRHIAETLRRSLQKRLEHNPWMGDETRRAALAKMSTLTFKIGYPDSWRDLSPLETGRSSLYANVLAARRFELQQRVARIDQPTNRSLWPMPPQCVNAGYDPQRNEIVFPAAILAPPFFDATADAPLNYGGIGAVIAHEMTHGFDDQGSRFGANGRFENWWSAEDRARFEALTARMVVRFERLSGDIDSIDGRLTLGENVADFGGLAVAFDAMQELYAGADADPMIDGYTRAQRFFFAWAMLWRQNLTLSEATYRLQHDPHAPATARANAAPANLAAYAEAFACRRGDPMRVEPANRIDIW